MPKLQYYIHHYLGCLCVLKGSTAPVRLHSISVSGIVSVSDPNAVDAGQYVGIEELTLLLRPLPDMSPAECLELCKIAAPTPFGDYRFSKWKVEKDPKSNEYWQAYTVMNAKSNWDYVVDLIDGDIMTYNSGDQDFTPINSCYRQWYYKKGFDIPVYPENKTLIELGLAIDINTLK